MSRAPAKGFDSTVDDNTRRGGKTKAPSQTLLFHYDFAVLFFPLLPLYPVALTLSVLWLAARIVLLASRCASTLSPPSPEARQNTSCACFYASRYLRTSAVWYGCLRSQTVALARGLVFCAPSREPQLANPKPGVEVFRRPAVPQQTTE